MLGTLGSMDPDQTSLLSAPARTSQLSQQGGALLPGFAWEAEAGLPQRPPGAVGAIAAHLIDRDEN